MADASGKKVTGPANRRRADEVRAVTWLGLVRCGLAVIGRGAYGFAHERYVRGMVLRRAMRQAHRAAAGGIDKGKPGVNRGRKATGLMPSGEVSVSRVAERTVLY